MVGLPVCFDGDFPETARALRLAGARVVVQASAYEVEAEGWWDGLYPARALENGQWWVMSNQCGRTPSGALLGGSQVISPLGRVVSRAVKVHELARSGRPGAAGGRDRAAGGASRSRPAEFGAVGEPP